MNIFSITSGVFVVLIHFRSDLLLNVNKILSFSAAGRTVDETFSQTVFHQTRQKKRPAPTFVLSPYLSDAAEPPVSSVASVALLLSHNALPKAVVYVKQARVTTTPSNPH